MRAFTLIELLIVTAIVGILGSIVMASWHEISCKQKPKAKGCEEVKATEESCSMYGNWSMKDVPVKCLKYFQVEITN